MAAIDSRYRGFLEPTRLGNTGDPTDAVRKWVAGITGLELSRVRRRWLAKPGTLPAIGSDWCAVGIDSIETPGTPDQVGVRGDLDKPESGYSVSVSHQRIRFVASFYGADALSLADAFREGAQVWQNRSELERLGLALQVIDPEARHVPDLVGEQWADRFDVQFTLGRAVARTYGVRTLARVGQIVINTEKGKL